MIVIGSWADPRILFATLSARTSASLRQSANALLHLRRLSTSLPRDLREILRLSGVTWSTHQQWLKQHCGAHGTGEREGHQLPHAGRTGMTG